jgi:hypothetical protein
MSARTQSPAAAPASGGHGQRTPVEARVSIRYFAASAVSLSISGADGVGNVNEKADWPIPHHESLESPARVEHEESGG